MGIIGGNLHYDFLEKLELLSVTVFLNTQLLQLNRSSFCLSDSVIKTAQQKEMKGVQLRKKDMKETLYTDDMPLYTENSKDYTKKNC